MTNTSFVSNFAGNSVAISHIFENKTDADVSAGSGVGIDFKSRSNPAKSKLISQVLFRIICLTYV